MCEGTDYLNVNPDVIAEYFLAVGCDLTVLAQRHPLVDSWFIQQGYSFEFGMVGEAYLVQNGRIVQGPETGVGAASKLFSRELAGLIDSMVGA